MDSAAWPVAGVFWQAAKLNHAYALSSSAVTHLEGQLEEAGGQGRLGQGGKDAAVAAHALAVGQRGVHLQGSEAR